MGQAVKQAAENAQGCQVVAGVDVCDKGDASCLVYKNIAEIKEKADVIIDFSNPAALGSVLEYAKNSNTPAVICTTGFSEVQVEEIKKASKTVPILYSRNMSLGINLLLELSRIAAKVLGDDFDIEIIEKHHNQKIDAPSGTALMIAEEISSSKGEKLDYVYDRTGVRQARTKSELGIHCIRGGTIAGDHEVIFAGNKEIVTLSHHAESREIFARGAIKAAGFLKNQNPGFYTMADVVGEA